MQGECFAPLHDAIFEIAFFGDIYGENIVTCHHNHDKCLHKFGNCTNTFRNLIVVVLTSLRKTHEAFKIRNMVGSICKCRLYSVVERGTATALTFFVQILCM